MDVGRRLARFVCRQDELTYQWQQILYEFTIDVWQWVGIAQKVSQDHSVSLSWSLDLYYMYIMHIYGASDTFDCS